MAKTPRVKKASTSTKSRAARRATSPSIDTDKSLKDVKPPTDDKDEVPSILGARPGANVSKKRQQKPMSRQQRLRKEKGMARADVVIEKTETKVGKSKVKAKVIKDRAADWEDLNTTSIKGKRTKKGLPNRTSVQTDEVMEDVVMDGLAPSQAAGRFDELEEIV